MPTSESKKDIYNIRVKAKDIYDLESDWASQKWVYVAMGLIKQQVKLVFISFNYNNKNY